MAHLGLPLTVEIGDEVYDLHRKKCLVKCSAGRDAQMARAQNFHYLASLPQDQWIQRLLVVERN